MNYSKYLMECHECLPGSKGEAYLFSRGFTADTLAHFFIGYDPQHDSIPIPYNRGMHAPEEHGLDTPLGDQALQGIGRRTKTAPNIHQKIETKAQQK